MKRINGFSDRRDEIRTLVKRMRKGDNEAREELRLLMNDQTYREVLAELYRENPEQRERRERRAMKERTIYRGPTSTMRGGAPGLGKKR